MPFFNRLLLLLFLSSFLISPQLHGAGARLFKSGPIQITADGQWIWTANQDNDSVSRIHTAGDEVTEIVLPEVNSSGSHSPRGLSVTEDGSEVWVACHDSDRVYVLSGEDGSVLERIDLPWGSGPHSAALSPDQTRALVTLHRSAALAVIEVASRQVTHILEPVYWSPLGIAWTEDGEGAWVTHLFAEGEHPFLTRVDFSDPEPVVSTRITVFATDPRHSSELSAPYDIAEGGYLTMRGHLAQIPSASGRQEVWMPIQYNNITEDRYSPDSTIQATIRRVDLNTRTLPNSNEDKIILTAVHVHDPAGNNAYEGPGWDAHISGPIDIGFSDDGSMTYLLNELSNDLVILPSDTPAVRPARANRLPEVPVGDRPMGLAVSPVTERAYVYNQMSRDVSVVDLGNQQELRRIPVTPESGEPFSATRLTGAKLFHTTDDPRLSGNQKVGCASCHINGETDGRSWAFHRLAGPHGPREVPSLLGLARTMGPPDPETGWGQLHLSGDRDEVQDFEHTIQSALMGGSGFLGEQVHPELGEPNAGLNPDLDALAHYVLSLKPLMRSPYRDSNGSLSEAAVRGATFFVGNNVRNRRPGDAGCAVCHVPEAGFVDFKFHDVGQRRPDSEEELNNRDPGWHVNTRTLVGVWTTPPYSGVSGFAPTMIEVLKDQAARAGSERPHGFPDGLTGRQLADLAEFVLSIDGNMTAEEIRNARDTHPPRIVRVSPTSLTRVEVWFNESVRPESVENVANWDLSRVGGGLVSVLSAEWEAQNGDRVSLTTAPMSGESGYILKPAGPIYDAADAVSGGTANLLELEDPQNEHSFHIGNTLTITLGASGYENLTIPVHDTAMVGPNLSTWSHDSIWLFPVNSGPRVNTGFVRFDWQERFGEATGVGLAKAIVDAGFSLHGELGDAQTLELRRVLKRWSDPEEGNDWNRNANGAPTWRDHAHPSARWSQSGAGVLRGSGNQPSDYNGSADLTAQVDARLTLSAINKDIHFEGDKLTEAYQFWFEHPELDYGHAIRLTTEADQSVKYERTENGLHRHGPVLEITYALKTARLQVEREGKGLSLLWPESPFEFALESADSLQGEWLPVPEPVEILQGTQRVTVQPSEQQTYYRLIAN